MNERCTRAARATADMIEVDDARNCVLGSAEPLREPFDRVLDRSPLIRRRAAVGLRAALTLSTEALQDSTDQMPAASSRHPSSSTAVSADATTRKLNATPAEVVLRKSIPTATVQTQTTATVGTMAVGLRQPGLSSQPTAVPARNGHAVSVSSSAWRRLPTAQKTSTPTISASAASALFRRIGHYVVIQWHDVGFVASGQPGLHRRGLPRRHHLLEVDR